MTRRDPDFEMLQQESFVIFSKINEVRERGGSEILFTFSTPKTQSYMLMSLRMMGYHTEQIIDQTYSISWED